MSDNLIERAEAMIGTIAHAKFARVSPAYPDDTYQRMVADLLAEVKRLTPRVIETVEELADGSLVGAFNHGGALAEAAWVFDGQLYGKNPTLFAMGRVIRVLYVPEGGE